MRVFAIFVIFCVSLLFPACSNITPEQSAQWNATATTVTQRAADLALDEAAWRLRRSRHAADPKR